MKIAAISDVHVKAPKDPAYNILCSFLTHTQVQSSDYIVLLGDIFDLMCGPHEEYLKDFKQIFDLMDDLRQAGKQVLFFEGNHDVHLQGLFLKRWPKQEIQSHQQSWVGKIDGKTYYFSHGDEHEVDNLKYQQYKELIMSPPLKFVANQIMSYSLLNFLGEKASKMSRKRGSKTYNEEIVRVRFRDGVTQTTQGKYDFILGGHSHVKDVFHINSHSTYINNGYALSSKSFILIDNHQISFPELTSLAQS